VATRSLLTVTTRPRALARRSLAALPWRPITFGYRTPEIGWGPVTDLVPGDTAAVELGPETLRERARRLAENSRAANTRKASR
jgi:hypothetical protein